MSRSKTSSRVKSTFGEKGRMYLVKGQKALDNRPMARAWATAMHNMLMVPIAALHQGGSLVTGGAKLQSDTIKKVEGTWKNNMFWGADAAHLVYTPINASTGGSIIPRMGSGSWYDQPICQILAPDLCYLFDQAAASAGEVEELAASLNRAEAPLERIMQAKMAPMIAQIPDMVERGGVARTMRAVYAHSLSCFSFTNFQTALDATLDGVRNRLPQHPQCEYVLPPGNKPSDIFEHYLAGNGCYSMSDLQNFGNWKAYEIFAKASLIGEQVKLVEELRENNYIPPKEKKIFIGNGIDAQKADRLKLVEA